MGSCGTRSCAGPRGCQVVRAFPRSQVRATLGPGCIRVSKDRGCCWPVLRLGHLSLQGRRGDLRSQHELRPHRV